jgi:hypothetical protein
MSVESKKEIQLEIAHVLFIAQDVAGDHAAAQDVGDRRAANWNLSSKYSRKTGSWLHVSR